MDIIQGRVPVTFRVTIFWNAPSSQSGENEFEFGSNHASTTTMDETKSTTSQKSQNTSTWQMLGRQKAFLADMKDVPTTTVEVPPVSILNVVNFDTIGDPEVSVLREDVDEDENGTTTRLMRWSCMYRAVLVQDHWDVHQFPHDEHKITLRLAILSQRQRGATWDRHVWKLALATPEDSQGSVRMPQGLVVDQVHIPGFHYNRREGLQFAFVPLEYGPGGGHIETSETCLEVTLPVWRNSSYYDRNIMPLLGMLHLVAITITALEAENFFERALLTLNIAFVEIGMRMTADSKLPTASYQIKMQRILNEYFFGLLFLVLESMLVYELHNAGYRFTNTIDWMAALMILSHNIYTLVTYYWDAKRISGRALHVPESKGKETDYLLV
jgi:hypothetical protein